MMSPVMSLSYEGYNILIEADILCGVVPDRWVFIDGKLNKWDNFVRELNSGLISFDRIKVGLRRYADLTQSITTYEQSDSKTSLEEEGNIRTEKHIDF